MMETDWLYTHERMALREKVLFILLKRFGGEAVPENNKAIYECAHDWVSQGNRNTEGLLDFYHENYRGTNEELPGGDTTE